MAAIGLIPALIAAGAAASAGTSTAALKKAHDEADASNLDNIELPRYPGEGIAKAVKKSLDTKLLKNELNNFLIEAVASGAFDSTDAKAIADSGYISGPLLAKLSPELQKKLARMTGQDIEQLISRLPDPNDDDDDDDKNDNDDDNTRSNKLKDRIDKENAKHKRNQEIRDLHKKVKNNQVTKDYDKSPAAQAEDEARHTRTHRWNSDISTKEQSPKKLSQQKTDNPDHWHKLSESELKDIKSSSNRAAESAARKNAQNQSLKDSAKADEDLKNMGLNIYLKDH